MYKVIKFQNVKTKMYFCMKKILAIVNESIQHNQVYNINISSKVCQQNNTK